MKLSVFFFVLLLIPSVFGIYISNDTLSGLLPQWIFVLIGFVFLIAVCYHALKWLIEKIISDEKVNKRNSQAIKRKKR